MNAWAIIQHKVYHDQEREECEVDGRGCTKNHDQGHHMLGRTKRFKRYLDNEVNYIPSCVICNSHNKTADTYEATKQLIKQQAERYNVREWLDNAPAKMKLGLAWKEADLILKEINDE